MVSISKKSAYSRKKEPIHVQPLRRIRSGRCSAEETFDVVPVIAYC